MSDAVVAAHAALDRARDSYWERTPQALAVALDALRTGQRLGDDGLIARAGALRGNIALHRGDVRGAFAIAAEVESAVERSGGRRECAEVAAFRAQLHFFSGSYAQALTQAETAIEHASAAGDLRLEVFVRRQVCVVLGNVGVRGWPQYLESTLALTIDAGDRWQEAVTRNDIAHFRMVEGDPQEALAELRRSIAILHELAPDNRFALGVTHCTRAEVHLDQDDPHAALEDTRLAIEHLTAGSETNHYLMGMTTVVQVRALLALQRLDEARDLGEQALLRIGEQLPQLRSYILTSLAGALRAAGYVDDAYDALERSAALERQAFRELSELQIGLERARLEMDAARREADAFALKNSELERAMSELNAAHTELEHRTVQLEGLKDALREEAERDWLTGLHNRRYLAREIERLDGDTPTGPFSVAVLDLDHFKTINDRWGHDIGDRVLQRIATLLTEVLRTSDRVVRSGGEEFVLLMPGTDERAARAGCERARMAVSGDDWSRIAPGLRLTVSIGVASTRATTALGPLVTLADRRLYDAKHAGRDRVVDAGGTGDGPPDVEPYVRRLDAV
jgi:diguanylate cyclase (GGDEF)-like protein